MPRLASPSERGSARTPSKIRTLSPPCHRFIGFPFLFSAARWGFPLSDLSRPRVGMVICVLALPHGALAPLGPRRRVGSWGARPCRVDPPDRSGGPAGTRARAAAEWSNPSHHVTPGSGQSPSRSRHRTTTGPVGGGRSQDGGDPRPNPKSPNRPVAKQEPNKTTPHCRANGAPLGLGSVPGGRLGRRPGAE